MSGNEHIPEGFEGPREMLNLNDPIPAYRANPCIGALGPVRTDDEITKLLTPDVPYFEEERRLPAHLRPHAAFALREFFLPGIPHMATVREVDLLIRQSYRRRNPLSRVYRAIMEQDRVTLDADRLPPNRYLFVPGLGSSAFGPPGCGKTLSCDFAVKDYPSAIRHSFKIRGERLSFWQIPVMKINLFQDGSLKSFGQEIFNQGEQILNVPLGHDWGFDHATGNWIQSLYFQFCLEYNVGIFVIDEFQLIQVIHEGLRRALGYFVRMMNCLGIAMIVVGTKVTSNLLKEDLAASRRFLGNIPTFGPFTSGPVWDAFFAKMAKYQYIEKFGPHKEISDTILEASGGIPDLAVKLFQLSQMRLVGKASECLTRKVIVETSSHLFHTVQDRLLELKGQRPETKGLIDAAKKVNETFKEIAAEENARVGGAPIPALEPELPKLQVELRTTAADDAATAVRDVANSTNPVAALEELGVVPKSL